MCGHSWESGFIAHELMEAGFTAQVLEEGGFDTQGLDVAAVHEATSAVESAEFHFWLLQCQKHKSGRGYPS